MKRPPRIIRCKKHMAGGGICGRLIGHCIHTYVPTLFGQRPQVPHDPQAGPQRAS